MSTPTTTRNSGTPPLPLLGHTSFVTDAGMETDLLFNHGVDLPHFAAFPLVEHDEGRRLLRAYYDEFSAIAAAVGAGLLLETPTWRANPDWAALLGFGPAELRRVNMAAVEFLDGLRRDYRSRAAGPVLISGMLGPRGDGYRSAGVVDPDEADRYHSPQIEALASAGADLVTAYTLSEEGEAVGIVRAARRVGVPVAISFTVETDGCLARGTSLADAVRAVDVEAPPDYYLVNCAHPSHIARSLGDGGWRERIVGLRANASARSHAELDEADELDEGDPAELARGYETLRGALPNIRIMGGCCGTDARHVAALWGV